LRPVYVGLAMRSAAALYGLGAGLLGVACVLEDDPGVRLGIGGLTVLALAVAVDLVWLDASGAGSLRLAFASDLLAVGVVAVFVGITDGAHSPYAPYFLLAALHAAAFQPRGRVLIAMAVTTTAFLAPLVYDRDEAAWFAGLAIPAVLSALVIVWITHLAVSALARERRTLAVREAEALRIAESDALTGIGNYRRFWRALESEAARSRRHDQPFSLIVLDLDGFKEINDELGHQAGDEALRRVALALQGELRVEDVLCRQGGDEFAVIAVAAEADETHELARRLVDAVRRSAGPGVPRPLSASAGWATFGAPETSAEGLLARADQALRDAKRGGRPGIGAAVPPGMARPLPRPSTMRGPERPHPTDRRLAALSACSRALALAPDERGVVQIAVVHVADALEASAVELWRRDPETGTPALVARGHHEGSSLPPDDPLPGEELEAVMAENHVAPLAEGGLLVPVSYGGRVDAVMVVRTPRARAPGLEERRLALAMAAQIGRGLAAVAARAALDRADPDDLEGLAEAAGTGPQAARVAGLAVAAGRELGLDPEELETLRRAALLHKVGMLGIPAGLSLSPTPLSDEEVEVLREHPIIAQRLLRPIPRLEEAARVLRHAYERHDGSGYPDGLAGEQIPPSARVLHAAIAYGAMREARPWRPALNDRETRDEMRRVAGTQLHPDAVDAVLRALDSPGVLESAG
jgi:diguanylate cyclase (GGDEF)-like protein